MRERNVQYSVTVQPAVEPVTIAELKLRLGIDGGDTTWDDLLTSLLVAGRTECERITGRLLITQTVQFFWQCRPGERQEWWDGVRETAASELVNYPSAFEIPRQPVQSISSITFYDEDDAGTVADSSTYIADLTSEPPRAVLRRGEVWPTTTLRNANGIVIEAVCGYGDSASTVPSALREGILAWAMYMFEHRGACNTADALSASGAAGLWDLYRQWRF